MGLFGKTPDLADQKTQVQEWTRKIRKEGLTLDRQIRGIQREEEKLKKCLKEAARKGDKDVCRIYAQGLIRSKKAISKIYTSKAQLNSIQLHMKEQLAVLKSVGAFKQSTEVLQAIQELCKLPQIAAAMREMSKEMMKAGVLEEMVQESFEGLEDADLEEAADEEVDNVLWQLTAGQLGKAPVAASHDLPANSAHAAAESDEEALDNMQSRLEALRN